MRYIENTGIYGYQIDAVNRGFITSLKIAFGESIHYETAESVSPSNAKVLPVNFSKENKSMVSHLANLFNSHKIAIREKYRDLIISLKTAIVNEFSYDKESSSYTDLFDSLRLSLRMCQESIECSFFGHFLSLVTSGHRKFYWTVIGGHRRF